MAKTCFYMGDGSKNDDFSGRDNFGPGGHTRTLLFLSRLSPLLRLVSPTLCMLVSQEGNLTNYPHPCRAFQHVCLKPGGGSEKMIANAMYEHMKRLKEDWTSRIRKLRHVAIFR